MKSAYPDLAPERARIQESVRKEEERFAETLDVGMRMIENMTLTHAAASKSASTSPMAMTVDGGFLFKLYDTHGLLRKLVDEESQSKGLLLSGDNSAQWAHAMA